MDSRSPGPDMTAAFGTLGDGDAGIVVTVDAEIADWAERHGYNVRTTSYQSGTFYEITPGDNGFEDPAD